MSSVTADLLGCRGKRELAGVEFCILAPQPIQDRGDRCVIRSIGVADRKNDGHLLAVFRAQMRYEIGKLGLEDLLFGVFAVVGSNATMAALGMRAKS